ncbi:MAG: radical SAM protein [Desulfobacterales bacterium]
MKVLLISANTEQINMPVMPLGLACVKQAVKEAGYEVHALNLMTRTDTEQKLPEIIDSFIPDVIGISVRNIDNQSMGQPNFLLEAVKDVAAVCRSLSKAPIVLGGAGYSIFPESALAYLKADFGIQGEGEWAFVELLACLKNRSHMTHIPGLYTANGPQFHGTREQRRLDAYPLPAPDLDLNVHGDFKPETIWLPFQTRRGCPMACSYCSTPAIEGRKLRKRSLENVISTFQHYTNAGFEQFFITDNTFNLPLSYAKNFCRLIIRNQLKIRWQAILYPLHIDEELIDLMARSGCVQVSLGFESGSRKILQQMNKRFSLESVQQISRMLQDFGIRRMGFLLLGGPDETRDTVEESLVFAEKLDLELMRLTAGIRIYPNTTLERIARAKKMLAPDDNLLMPTFYMEKPLAQWLPERISKWMKTHPAWIVS